MQSSRLLYGARQRLCPKPISAHKQLRWGWELYRVVKLTTPFDGVSLIRYSFFWSGVRTQSLVTTVYRSTSSLSAFDLRRFSNDYSTMIISNHVYSLQAMPETYRFCYIIFDPGWTLRFVPQFDGSAILMPWSCKAFNALTEKKTAKV